MSLEGKSVFVTGGNSGIGLAGALRFAREGANITIFARRAESNAEARALVEAQGVRCLTFVGDVGDEAALRDAVVGAVKGFGGLHYALNAAGAMQSVTPLTDLTAEEFETIFSANARGTFLSMKHQIPAIRDSGGGAICNCASTAGIVPSAFQVAYAAAKFAVVALTRGAALEAASLGVRVNVVCPGATTGEMWFKFKDANPERAKLVLAKHPLGRVGDKEEVADAVLFLCRDATFTTGHALTVDGGRTAG
ncbi:MAG: SDR family oxidoreductase [Hyphomonadaceae bacterium]|nr:SDR family oxidoreductase [Hyphomonadaceae bacterium]